MYDIRMVNKLYNELSAEVSSDYLKCEQFWFINIIITNVKKLINNQYLYNKFKEPEINYQIIKSRNHLKFINELKRWSNKNNEK
jgi:hypothetical protein